MGNLAASASKRLRSLSRARDLRDGAAIHFLHVGKNAGTQIKSLSEPFAARGSSPRIVTHPHRVTLLMLPREARYFFSLRDPVSRFRSGFYSRKRKGQPRIYHEWSPHERRAFESFEHANDLAEALFTEDRRGHQATAAIRAIQHTAMNQVDWFTRAGHLLDLRPPVWIIRTERFDQDWAEFSRRVGLPATPAAPAAADGTAARHSNDYSGTPPLSDLAKGNLRRWYAQDIAFYAMCENWMNRQLAGAGAGAPATAG